MSIPSSDTGGVKPMPIAGRVASERERLQGMTSEERAWRKQWLRDQVLSASEPRHVPEYWNERINPIRKFYRWPLDRLGEALTPVLGKPRAETVRFFSGKILIFVSLVYMGRYYMKYNAHDWTKRGGWRVMENREATLPGQTGFPHIEKREFAVRGFDKSPI